MSRYDATQSNESKRSAKIYRDLDLDFSINSATKDIQKLSDVESVKRSVRNLINTNHYERPFHPEIGSNLRAMLFENITPQMTHALSKQIDLLMMLLDLQYYLTLNFVNIPVEFFLFQNGIQQQLQ